jgi:hypothetical protein
MHFPPHLPLPPFSIQHPRFRHPNIAIYGVYHCIKLRAGMIVCRDLGEVSAKDFDGCEGAGVEEGLQLGCCGCEGVELEWWWGWHFAMGM